MKDLNKNIKNSGVPQETLEKFNKLEDSDIIELKKLLQNHNPDFMSTLLQITIGLEEEKLACFMIAYYDTKVSHLSKYRLLTKLSLTPLRNSFYQFLNYLWAFGKNILMVGESNKMELLTYVEIINVVGITKDHDQEEIKNFVEHMVKWLVETDDNLLIALLKYGYDEVSALFDYHLAGFRVHWVLH